MGKWLIRTIAWGGYFDALRQADLDDKTLVIITSDHGENLGEHGMIDHLLSMYDTTLHVPLVMRYPKVFSGGRRYDGLVSLVDVFPTILDVCGLQNAAEGLAVAGHSLCDPDTSGREFVIAENDRPVNGVQLMKNKFPDFQTAAIDHPMRAIRTADNKLIWTLDVGREFYDLVRDPQELDDIALQQPTAATTLQGVLKRWMEHIGTVDNIGLFDSQDAESLEKLRSLGYIE